MEYDKNVLDAMADTIRAYEQAICDIKESGIDEAEVWKIWDNYADENDCRLCVATDIPSEWHYGHCAACPLGPESEGCLKGGVFWRVHNGIGVGGGAWVKHLKARLAWMVKKIGKNGLEVID